MINCISLCADGIRWRASRRLEWFSCIEGAPLPIATVTDLRGSDYFLKEIMLCYESC